MVEKLLTPGGIEISELSKEIGVSNQTLYNWRYKFVNKDDIAKSPHKWNMKEKYSALIEASGFSGEKLGKWLIQTGIADLPALLTIMKRYKNL